jgi:hypothetical protein
MEKECLIDLLQKSMNNDDFVRSRVFSGVNFMRKKLSGRHNLFILVIGLLLLNAGAASIYARCSSHPWEGLSRDLRAVIKGQPPLHPRAKIEACLDLSSDGNDCRFNAIQASHPENVILTHKYDLKVKYNAITTPIFTYQGEGSPAYR